MGVTDFSIVLQVRDFVGEQMSLRGIEFHAEETPQAIIKSSDGLLSLKTNKGTVDGFTHVMFATGRRPNTKVKISHVVHLRLHLSSKASAFYAASNGLLS